MYDCCVDVDLGEELVARARSLRPLLLRNAPLSEAGGELTSEVISALVEADLFKMCVPRRWGGLCVSANAMARVVEELARGCPSTGWVVTVMNTTVWRITMMSDQTQEDIFAKHVPLVCGVAVPPGRARKVDGGYIVESGRWPYASGSHHAELFHAPIRIEGVKGAAPLAIFPMSDLKIERTWKVAGMRATGSDTVVADNVFVPDHRVPFFEKPFDYGSDTRKHVGELSDFWTALPLMRTKSLGVLVGAAEGLLDYVRDGLKEKPLLFTDYRRRGDSHVFVTLVGKAAAKIRAVRTMMDQMTRAIDAAALTKQDMQPEDRATNRGQMALAIDLLTEAVEMLMNGAGSSAFLEASNAQRFWRDFSVGARHVSLVPEPGYEVYGRSVLGEPQAMKLDYT
jgi:alkylation response protein AidB-like acyl-CoA dehydrogenase